MVLPRFQSSLSLQVFLIDLCLLCCHWTFSAPSLLHCHWMHPTLNFLFCCWFLSDLKLLHRHWFHPVSNLIGSVQLQVCLVVTGLTHPQVSFITTVCTVSFCYRWFHPSKSPLVSLIPPNFRLSFVTTGSAHPSLLQSQLFCAGLSSFLTTYFTHPSLLQVFFSHWEAY